ncbi:hypothetical protein F965_00053 [Acinetobacter schindleri NIPH 900]|uniref:Uncharacterized protein n=1 Tax=Acinetobacter schindleri NIPH 900 TaxID=1217675 RepID=N8WRH9_9GAMM|nr:hypothetical protein [Acinetobacter schindleri]ENV14707.1 hypothetical protein F965_00053 [Acinetobacter schindleri NIPH 900]
MSESKVIYRLPCLEEHQEWACIGGCSDVKAKLHRNVYRQSWNAAGVLINEEAEFYYTCQNGHLLEVWDRNAVDYVELPEIHYKEHTNEHGLTIADIDNLIGQIEEPMQRLNSILKDTNSPFFNAVLSIEIEGKEELSFSLNYLKELRTVLLDQQKNAIMPDGPGSACHGVLDSMNSGLTAYRKTV